MSIETLLEAAKFVEWSDQIGHAAREQNDQEALNVSPDGRSGAIMGLGTVTPTVPSSPSSSPGSHKSLSPRTSYESHQLSTSNTDTFDEGDEKRSGTREVHNKLEKNRRAHLKECFDNLRDTIPNMEDKKMKPSNLSILQGALRYLQALKRKERDLEYEADKLERQKKQYHEKLAKLSGCSLPPLKKDEPEIKMETELEIEDVMEDDDEDDRDSVSTSTSTASEAEEEERKSRAQSPEVRSGQPVLRLDQPGHIAGAPTVTTDPLSDHVIKVTQSVNEQSGPFVISRRIVTHVPLSTATAATAGQQQPLASIHMPAGANQQQQQQGSNPWKATNQQPQTMPGPLDHVQQWVVGTKRHLETAKQVSQQKAPGVTQVVTQQVAASQTVVIRSQAGAQQVGTPHVTTPESGAAKQATTLKQVKQTPSQGQPVTQPKITSHVVRQFDSHSSAVSAVQEHLKNRAQSKLPQQQKQPSRTISHTTPTTETIISSKGNVTVVNTAAVTTTSSSVGATRQTVSQLLGKQSMVIRQPVRRTDNKFVMQRVVRHPFSPRPQTIDIMPKSLTTLPSNDVIKTHVSHSTPTSFTVVAYKEPQPIQTTSVTSSNVSVTSSNATGKQGIPFSSTTVQHVTPPAGLDVRNLISHNVMLPSIPQYLPTAELTSTMLRPSLTNPSVLTAANAALFSQAMMASTRNISPQLTIPGSKDSGQAKHYPPVSGPLSFLSPAVAQQGKVSQVKPSSLSPLTPVHPFLSPGLTLQPALTQVLFTQPPMAAYTVANSSLAHSLVKSTLSPQTVIRHPLAPPPGADVSQVLKTIATVVGTSATISQTTAAMTMHPVVTIGAVSLDPLLGANRALITTPTYTTLSFGQYPNYRFPFAGQVPFISPVAFTGNPSSAAVPATSVGNQTATNRKSSNGVIVHTVAVPTAVPATSAWLSPTTMSNGVPAKELTSPVPTWTSTPTSVAMVTTQPAVTGVSSSQEGGVSDSKITSGSSVLTKSSS